MDILAAILAFESATDSEDRYVYALAIVGWIDGIGGFRVHEDGCDGDTLICSHCESVNAARRTVEAMREFNDFELSSDRAYASV